jgi:ketosteroid isomerase-like protein
MKTMGLLLALICSTSLAASAQEVADGGTVTTVRALERQWAEAQSRNDSGVLDLIFDNALVYMEYGGLVTKGEYLSRIKAAKPEPLLGQIVMEAMEVHSFGSAAIVVGTYRETSAKDGKPRLKRWRFVDTWVKKNERWMLVAAAATPLSK